MKSSYGKVLSFPRSFRYHEEYFWGAECGVLKIMSVALGIPSRYFKPAIAMLKLSALRRFFDIQVYRWGSRSDTREKMEPEPSFFFLTIVITNNGVYFIYYYLIPVVSSQPF